MSREKTKNITNKKTQKTQKESLILNSPMITIEKIDKISEQMKKSVCEINNLTSKCTGFFAK